MRTRFSFSVITGLLVTVYFVGACGNRVNPLNPEDPFQAFRISVAGGLVTPFEGSDVAQFAKAYKLFIGDKKYFRLEFQIQVEAGEAHEMASIALLLPVEADSREFPAPGQYRFGPSMDGVRLGSFSYTRLEGPSSFVKLHFEAKSLKVIVTSSNEQHLTGHLTLEMVQKYGERMLDGIKEDVELAHSGTSYATIDFELDIEEVPQPIRLKK